MTMKDERLLSFFQQGLSKCDYQRSLPATHFPRARSGQSVNGRVLRRR